MSIGLEQEVGTGVGRTAPKRRRLPGAGLLKGLGVTLKHMLQRSITQEYPDEKPNLPPRTRGVLALKEANCTVCYKCSRECPDWWRRGGRRAPTVGRRDPGARGAAAGGDGASPG